MKIFILSLAALFAITASASANQNEAILKKIERLSFDLGKEIAIASPCFASSKCKVKKQRSREIFRRKTEVSQLIVELVDSSNVSKHIYKKIVYLSKLQSDFAAAKILKNSFMGGTPALKKHALNLTRRLPKEISKVRSVIKINI